ncbi:MAG TPA: hypothetical protein VGF56_04660 [Rhizomicrobium sp.]|jgi:hypothetical protein
MTNYSQSARSSGDGEVPGSRAFYVAIIIAVAMVLMGAVWQVAPHADQPATRQAEVTQPVQAG